MSEVVHTDLPKPDWGRRQSATVSSNCRRAALLIHWPMPTSWLHGSSCATISPKNQISHNAGPPLAHRGQCIFIYTVLHRIYYSGEQSSGSLLSLGKPHENMAGRRQVLPIFAVFFTSGATIGKKIAEIGSSQAFSPPIPPSLDRLLCKIGIC